MKQVLADYMQLTKPRIMVMILLTVAVAVLAVPGSTSIWIFFHAMIGRIGRRQCQRTEPVV